MEWLKEKVKEQLLGYILNRVGIVFATVVGGYAATLLIRKLRGVVEQPLVEEEHHKRKKRVKKIRRRIKIHRRKNREVEGVEEEIKEGVEENKEGEREI